jgi:hypothetical protein
VFILTGRKPRLAVIVLAVCRTGYTRVAPTDHFQPSRANALQCGRGCVSAPSCVHSGSVGINHLGHFAFDAQVRPAVRRSSAPRVVTSAPPRRGGRPA